MTPDQCSNFTYSCGWGFGVWGDRLPEAIVKTMLRGVLYPKMHVNGIEKINVGQEARGTVLSGTWIWNSGTLRNRHEPRAPRSGEKHLRAGSPAANLPPSLYSNRDHNK